MNISKLKIVELSSVLAGPSVGMFFAELGCEVIKIENKKEGGDITRQWKLVSEDKNSSISAYYSAVNYNKKSVFLDFYLEDDLQKLQTYLKNCDIVILNFKEKDYAKFSLTFEDLVTINPKIIYAKITGFEEGSNRVAYDLVLQAETGLMFMNGQEDSEPTKFPIAIIDLFAAHQLKEGILVALFERMFDNKPKKITVSLYESAIASLANQASNYLMENHIPTRQGSLHPNIAPYGEIFTTEDAKQMTLAIGSDKQFINLMEYLQIDCIDKFKTNQLRIENRQELFKIIEDKISKKSSKEIKIVLEKKEIPYGFIKNLAEVFEEKTAQNMILEETLEGKITKRVKTVAFKF